VCQMLEGEKCNNVLLRKLVKLLKQQTQDMRTDLMHIESILTSEQRLQSTGD